MDKKEEIKLQKTQSLVPPLYYTLSKVKENELSYQYYAVRHPGAIFSIHFSDLVNTFNNLYKKVNNLQAVANICSDQDREELRSLTQNFLLLLNRYFESGYEVFLCFCPQVQKPPVEQPLFQWFEDKSYKTVIEKYFINTTRFLKRYRKILNALKHSSNQLSIFQFVNPDNQGSTLGFYLEGVDDKGVTGPLVEFHPMHDGRYTAWSYNLHFKHFYYLIYKIASEIESVVSNLCSTNNIILPSTTTALAVPNLDTLSRDAFNSLKRLDAPVFFYFPQEGDEKTKIVSLAEDNGTLIFSDTTSPERVIPKGARAVMTSRGDGFSRSWSLLYFKDDSQQG